jgi:hypothetical protein
MAALRIQLRRDTAANWVSNNPILLSGELGIETDTLKFKIGNGSRWNATTSYALKAGEANGLATLNSLGKIPTSQLPDSMSVSADLAAAIAALTTNSISEGSTNKYFTNQRAIDAVSLAISSAIATESINRNTAIATAKTEAINTAASDATNKAATAKTEAISAAAAAADTKDTISAAAAVSSANSYTDTKVATETSNRNIAINNAISTEITNRNTAINAAVSAIPSGGSSTITLGTVSTGNPGTSVSITNTGTATAPLFNFTIPRGDVGPQGLKGDTGAAGTAGATGDTGATGPAGPQGLKGDTGAAGAAGTNGTNGTNGIDGTSATVTVGTVTTAAAGSSASVINSGTTSAAVLNFTIPRGADGTGGSSFTGNSDSITEGTTNLYFTNERASAANNQRFTDVYVNINAATDEILTYAGNTFVTIQNLDNRLDGYVMEADADLGGGYAKIGVASGTILDSVIPSTIARTSDISSQIAAVVNGAPASFDTLKEIADYIATDQTAASSLTTLVGTKLSSTTAASTYAPIISPTFTGTVSGITKSMVGLANVDNTSDSSKPISTATQTALDTKLSTATATSTYATISNVALKAPLASPAFTGTVDFSGATVTGLSTLPAQLNNSGKYLTTNGTAASWADLNLTAYATKASPAFTGTVDFSGATVTGLTTTIADSSITSAKILDGAIMNIDINASAAIDKTKIAGTAVTLADTASVTNAMLANSFVGINGNAVYLGQVITIPVGAKTFYNNTGTLPTTGMVAGDIYIQY